VFERLKNLTYWKLFKWGIKRHRRKSRKWIKNKYFQSYGGKNWIFATKKENNSMRLLSHPETKIVRFVKVKGEASPYDGNLVYWSSRQGKNPEMPKRKASLLKKQKGKCTWCGLSFKDGDVIEKDHIIPKSNGGKDEYKNWQLLHRHCHDEKTSIDGSVDKSSKLPKLPDNWSWIEDMLVMC
jgi:RNA-directed DNA polymerase